MTETPAVGALISLSKLMRALGYYPSDHPALGALSGEAEIQWQLLLQSGEVSFSVTRTGFSTGGVALDPKNDTLRALACSCHERRISALTVKPGLEPRELICFVQALLLKPEELYLEGGCNALLQQQGVQHIATTDLQLQNEHANTPPAKPPQPTLPRQKSAATARAEQQKPRPNRPLKELLQELRQASSDQLPKLMGELQVVAPPALIQHPQKAALAIFPLLFQALRTPDLSPESRQSVDRCSEHLATTELLETLTDALRNNSLPDTAKRTFSGLIQRYADRILPKLLLSWRQADDTARAWLLPALQDQRDAVLALLEKQLSHPGSASLGDILLLGELGGPEQVPALHPLLTETRPEFRAAAFSALTRIGGDEVVDHLLQLARQPGSPAQLPAIAALGQLQSKTAIPVLLKAAFRPDPLRRHTDERLAAIKALGRIEDHAVTKALMSVLTQRRPFWKAPAPLRAAAAMALGRSQHPSVNDALQKARNDRNPQVRQAATAALQRLEDRR